MYGLCMSNIRRELRAGYVLIPEKFGLEGFKWAGGVNFKALDELPESVKWWFSCLGFIRVLFIGSPIQESDELICKEIIADFFEHNCQLSPSFSRAWDGHAVAYRAIVLIDLYKISNDKTYLLPLLRKHLDFLYSEENFQGHWNHGIDQSIALIKLGECLADKIAIDLGVARLCDSLKVVVDDEGVSIEQAIHYQLYSYKQVMKSVDVINSVCDDDNILSMLNALLDKRKLMGDFLAHATKPDGSYFEIGDTPLQRAEIIGHEEADYAASLGEIGKVPKERFKVYKAGYIFGHSQWGEVKEASAYSIRFGLPRRVHGHNDHSSVIYFTDGREIIREGGFHGYTDDEHRGFLRSLKAHNVVYVEDPKLRFKSCHSHLIACSIKDKVQKYTVLSNPYDGVESTRTLVFSQNPEAMVVIDSLESDKEVRAVQRWNFGKNIILKCEGGDVLSESGGFKITQCFPYDEIRVDNEGDDGNQPLVSSGAMYQLESCSSVMTFRSGRRVTFLTVFCFSNDGDFPVVYHSKSSKKGVRRMLSISKGDNRVEVNFLDNGNVDVV